jgi:hypothetical protein
MLKRFSRLAAIVTACAVMFCVSTASRAQTPAPTPQMISLAKQIIDLKGSTTQFDAVLPGIINQAKQVVLQTNPMLDSDLSVVGESVLKEFTPRLQELHDNVAKIYASKFSEKELADILAFYKSPLGQKIVTTEPKILDESVVMTDTWVKGISDKVVDRIREEMRKKGHNL